MTHQPSNPDSHRIRPNMPGYGITSEDEGMLAWEWVRDQMTKSRNYWVCSTQSDGRPHAAPVWGIWADDALYFSTSRTSRKGRNLADRADVVIHLESGDDTVILEGRVEETSDRALLTRITDLYGAKYPFKPSPEPEPGNVWYIVRPRAVLAWRETSFPNTATRWVFPA
ncbi:MAG: pyridoxamine 5'-phosphate oxidase family protein [Anaerolineae bacterium]|nr:pyridoxamine 5'-phosphate oxidase family protein [Anaerolineae bacterium]